MIKNHQPKTYIPTVDDKVHNDEESNCEVNDTIMSEGLEVSKKNPKSDCGLENNIIRDETVESPYITPYKRGRRQAAIKSSKQFKKLISEGLLMVRTPTKKLQPPDHAWNWNDFFQLWNMENTWFVSKDRTPSAKLDRVDEVQQAEESIFDMNEWWDLVTNMSDKRSYSGQNALEDTEEGLDNSLEQHELIGNNDENRPMTGSHLQNQAVNVNDEDAGQSSGQALDVPQQEVHEQAHQESQHLQDDQYNLRPGDIQRGIWQTTIDMGGDRREREKKKKEGCRIIKTCFFRSFCVSVLKCVLNRFLTKFLISVVAA